MVTPDGQRTMSTYLGACTQFGEADVDAGTVRDSAVTYLEGYLFDEPAAQAAFRKAAALAHASGRQVALSLSDSFCVERHRAAFLALLKHVDILFANEQEIAALFETGFEAAAEAASRAVPLAVLTRGAAGSLALRAATGEQVGGERVEIASAPTTVLDSTGAGDAYAAGFLFGLTRGLPLAECGRIASLAAAEIISHYGARPEADLKALARV
jgi:sugar/nucleoside kinase (ribokinase family)